MIRIMQPTPGLTLAWRRFHHLQSLRFVCSCEIYRIHSDSWIAEGCLLGKRFPFGQGRQWSTNPDGSLYVPNAVSALCVTVCEAIDKALIIMLPTAFGTNQPQTLSPSVFNNVPPTRPSSRVSNTRSGLVYGPGKPQIPPTWRRCG